MEITIICGASDHGDRIKRDVQQALEYVGLRARIVVVEGTGQYRGRTVSATPAIVIGGEVKVEGRAPTQAELTTWITTEALNEEQQ